jgi:ABC-type branched-subunit amino acid transport system ATPase component
MTTDAPATSGLVVEGVEVHYGGLVAVQGVSLHAPEGRITGLIGPNGAGKTTMFNALSGLLQPHSGSIRLFDEDVRRQSPASRAQRGLGRTFQRMELFDSLTVFDNVALGREAGLAGRNPLRHLIGRPGDRQSAQLAARDALALCGLDDLAGRRVGSLSTGQRRLVELARTVAGQFRILLLDEPSSGLDAQETRRFGEILRRIVGDTRGLHQPPGSQATGAGILLVEHDMALVMEVCQYLYVIDFGRPIFEGTPAEVANSDVVRSAYLGTEAVGVG